MNGKGDGNRSYLLAFGGLLVLHGTVWFSLGMALDLHPDTTDHWVWSRHLSWGYYEHPPLIAWVMRLFTTCFGDTPFALHLGSQTLSLLSSVVLFLLARNLFGFGPAFWAVAALEAAPLYSVGSLVFIIDSVLLLFYLLTAYFFWKGLEENRGRFWFLGGLTFGLALLSKLTAVLFPLAGAVFLLTHPRRRPWFKKPGPYLALAWGLLLFTPFLYWNSAHQWIAFRGQLEKGLTGGQGWGQTAGFWLGQPVILGPALFLFFLAALFQGLRKTGREDRYAYPFWLTVVPLIFFGLASFRGKYTDPSWTVIGWPFGAALFGQWFHQGWLKTSKVKTWILALLVLVSGWLPIGLIAVHTFRPFLPLGPYGDRTLEFKGWKELGAAAGKAYDQFFPGQSQVYILADDYQLAGSISFYAPQKPWPYSFGKPKRNQWVEEEEMRRTGALLVCPPNTCQQDQAKARAFFENICPAGSFSYSRGGRLAKRYDFYLCTN